MGSFATQGSPSRFPSSHRSFRGCREPPPICVRRPISSAAAAVHTAARRIRHGNSNRVGRSAPGGIRSSSVWVARIHVGKPASSQAAFDSRLRPTRSCLHMVLATADRHCVRALPRSVRRPGEQPAHSRADLEASPRISARLADLARALFRGGPRTTPHVERLRRETPARAILESCSPRSLVDIHWRSATSRPRIAPLKLRRSRGRLHRIQSSQSGKPALRDGSLAKTPTAVAQTIRQRKRQRWRRRWRPGVVVAVSELARLLSRDAGSQ